MMMDKINLLALLIISTELLFGTVIANESVFEILEPIVCLKGHEVCDFNCYDPKTHHCLKQGSLSTACPLELTACGNECYSIEAKTHVCHESTGFKVLCPTDSKQCGYLCYREDENQKCINDTVCNEEHNFCNGQCYDPKESICYERGLCPIGEEICSFSCFKPSADTVCTDEGDICSTGEKSCGGQCYLPKEGDTCYRGAILCREGTKICGNRCYSAENGDQCLNEYAVCKAGEKLCGKYNCYSPEDGQQCFEEENGNSGIICEADESSCEGRCYKKATEDCFIYEKSGVICPKGEMNCSNQCYSPEKDQVCLTNLKGKNVICQKGQSVCGSTCYTKSEDFVCIPQEFPNEDVVCKMGEKACGYKCYDPETQICLHGKSPIRPL